MTQQVTRNVEAQQIVGQATQSGDLARVRFRGREAEAIERILDSRYPALTSILPRCHGVERLTQVVAGGLAQSEPGLVLAGFGDQVSRRGQTVEDLRSTLQVLDDLVRYLERHPGGSRGRGGGVIGTGHANSVTGLYDSTAGFHSAVAAAGECKQASHTVYTLHVARPTCEVPASRDRDGPPARVAPAWSRCP